MTTPIQNRIEEFDKKFGNLEEIGPDSCKPEVYKVFEGSQSGKDVIDWLEKNFKETEQEARAKERERIIALVPKEKPMGVFSFVLKGEELETYMQYKGFNECRGIFLESLKHPQ